jgi:hypothetical protein
VIGAIIQKEILVVVMKLHTWRRPPEIDTILLCAIEILQGAFEVVIINLVQTRI